MLDETLGVRRSALRRRSRCLVGLLIVAGFLHAAPRAPTEYEVKAAFLYNFAKYIQWPALSGADSRRPLVIGIIGKDPFGPVLDEVMRGQSVQKRAVVVRRFGRIDDVTKCDILFIASSEMENLPQILRPLRGAPVLTVGDMNGFAERGGMISLTTEENRIRFSINVDAMERVRLKPGAQLLRLARIVQEPDRGGE